MSPRNVSGSSSNIFSSVDTDAEYSRSPSGPNPRILHIVSQWATFHCIWIYSLIFCVEHTKDPPFLLCASLFSFPTLHSVQGKDGPWSLPQQTQSTGSELILTRAAVNPGSTWTCLSVPSSLLSPVLRHSLVFRFNFHPLFYCFQCLMSCLWV